MLKKFCEIVKHRTIKVGNWNYIEVEQFSLSKIYHIHKVDNNNKLTLTIFYEGIKLDI